VRGEKIPRHADWRVGLIIIIIIFPLLSHTGEIHIVAPREAPWCLGSDSNLWPHDHEADALPLELSGQGLYIYSRILNSSRKWRVGEWLSAPLVHDKHQRYLQICWYCITPLTSKHNPLPLDYYIHRCCCCTSSDDGNNNAKNKFTISFSGQVVRCLCALCFCAVFVSLCLQAAFLLCVASMSGSNDISPHFELPD
jgi:hypothetical protein